MRKGVRKKLSLEESFNNLGLYKVEKAENGFNISPLVHIKMLKRTGIICHIHDEGVG